MFRRLSALFLAACALLPLADALAQKPAEPSWVWFDEGDPLANAPSGERYFRRTFAVDKAPAKATLHITADNRFTLHVNGKEVGSGDRWETLYRFDVTKHLAAGKNTLAVTAGNDGGPAGLVVRLTLTGGAPAQVVSDAAWEASQDGKTAWKKARVLGTYGKVGPWAGGGSSGPGKAPKFTVPAGFRVEQMVKTPDDRGPFSLVNMTFDAKGRLLVSQEGKGILVAEKPGKDGVFAEVREYCNLVRNCHGMLWSKGALYLVGDGPKGTGLYRCRDTKNSDAIDEAVLIHRFQGGMGEHGPHAVIEGPDDKLYVVVGNHAFAKIGPKMEPNPAGLAKNSPIRRWPTGGQGPDQGKPGTTEDVLLPRLDDANGHAAGIRAPGGTIWRMDHDGKNVSLYSAGFRNQFDAAFNPDGELFSYDSDMEWDENLPWYRPVRAIHCVAGADFGWRTGAANQPPYHYDFLPPLYDTGRGSPVGVCSYDHVVYPAKYRGSIFLADWSVGVIYAMHLKKKGATYEPTVEKFCTGSPLNVTDLETGPDGCIWFTMGGRGSRGGVYRIVPESPAAKAPTDGSVQPLAAWSRAQRASAGVKDAFRETTPEAALKAMGDPDAFVRRKACESVVRLGATPEVAAVLKLLADDDIFVRHAARIVLENIPADKWLPGLASEKSDRVAREMIACVAKLGKVRDNDGTLFDRLVSSKPTTVAEKLDHVRAIQLICCQTTSAPESLKKLAAACDGWFPSGDWRLDRELAIVLTHFEREKILTGVPTKILDALAATKDRAHAIHYAYCLRLIPQGWTPAQREAFAAWYDATKTWTGGHSFRPFLENIFRESLSGYDVDARKAILAKGDTLTQAAFVTAQRVARDRQTGLGGELLSLADKIATSKASRAEDLRRAIDEALIRGVPAKPTAADLPVLVRGLAKGNKVVAFDAMSMLLASEAKPKSDDAAAFRAVIEASAKLDVGNRWKAVELLRHWTGGREFGAEKGQWQRELQSWARWYTQSFPTAPKVPVVEDPSATPPKYSHELLLKHLTTGDGKTGDVARGAKVFEKALCAKCHKHGKIGEGLGPDLSTLAKRFKRAEMLESVTMPSKVISDQYRSTSVETNRGQRVEGLLAETGETVTVLQNDGTKVTLRKKDIASRVSSLVSVMPEKLMDPLTLGEIADLFAFLETEGK